MATRAVMSAQVRRQRLWSESDARGARRLSHLFRSNGKLLRHTREH